MWRFPYRCLTIKQYPFIAASKHIRIYHNIKKRKITQEPHQVIFMLELKGLGFRCRYMYSWTMLSMFFFSLFVSLHFHTVAKRNKLAALPQLRLDNLYQFPLQITRRMVFTSCTLIQNYEKMFEVCSYSVDHVIVPKGLTNRIKD